MIHSRAPLHDDERGIVRTTSFFLEKRIKMIKQYQVFKPILLNDAHVRQVYKIWSSFEHVHWENIK